MERTLSRNEARVVLDLEWRECETVTLAEIRAALDASEGYARKFAHGLVRKGWFERLRLLEPEFREVKERAKEARKAVSRPKISTEPARERQEPA